MRLRAIALVLIMCCGPGSERPTGPCVEGATRCTGNELQVCTNGKFGDSQNCPNACDDMLGCVLCVPGTGTCMGEVSHACNGDGQGYTDVDCDPLQGETCGSAGVCDGACSPKCARPDVPRLRLLPDRHRQSRSSRTYDFAVVVSNTDRRRRHGHDRWRRARRRPTTFTAPAGKAVTYNPAVGARRSSSAWPATTLHARARAHDAGAS